MSKKISAWVLGVGVLWLLSLAASFADCSDEEYSFNDNDWADFCVNHDLIDENDTCKKDIAKEAKTNMDWVLFRDQGARSSYLSGLAEARRCAPGSGENFFSFMALLHAQKHDARAQCTIALCRQEYTAAGGYYDKLKEAGKLPQLPASTPGSDCHNATLPSGISTFWCDSWNRNVDGSELRANPD